MPELFVGLRRQTADVNEAMRDPLAVFRGCGCRFVPSNGVHRLVHTPQGSL